MFSRKCILVWLFSLFFFPASAFASLNEVKITASDPGSEDLFGEYVSISGDYAVVGAYKNDSGKGSVYVFKKDGEAWVEETKLQGADLSAGDWFGRAVAIDGDYIVVGAYIQNASRGAVYVFKRDGADWSQQAKLAHPEASDNDFLGFSVDISGDTIVASAHGEDDAGENSGAVYVFKRDGEAWAQQAKLAPSDLGAGNLFGRNVSIDGDYIATGAYAQGAKGAGYIFKRTGDIWTQQVKIPGPPSLGGFAKWAAISGEFAVFYCNLSAYIFKRTGTDWTQQEILRPAMDHLESGRIEAPRFSLKGNTIVLGYYTEDGEGGQLDAGAAYIYQSDGQSWTQVHKLTASDPGADDFFGKGVSVDGDYVLVGAVQDDLAAKIDAGSAYIYKFQDTPQTTLTIVPDNTIPVIGDTLCFDVNIADSDGLYSSAFDLTYDPTALQYQGASEGNFLNSDSGATFFEASLLNNDPSAGIVVVGVSRVADIGEVAGSGTIATVCFSVIGGSGADTSVGIDNGHFEGAEPGTPVDVIEGEDPVVPVEIGVPVNLLVTDPGTLDRLDLSWDVLTDASGYEVYRATSSGGTFTLIGTTASNSYQDSDCILTNVAYYYKIKAISAAGNSTGAFSGEASGMAIGLAGDINKDNRVDGRDLTLLARAFNTVTGDADYNCQADLDRSERIDGDDLVILAASFGDQV
ncbi:MAG: dockerin type I domain-containing protein [Desulfobacter sp.]